MKTVGIIAEFNPFHNGHKYLIEKAKAMTGADTAVVIMSGDFVQRGAPAVCDKYLRTRMALAGGADIVFELPTVYALSSAEIFAEGGVRLLSSTLNIDAICFGSECGDIAKLEDFALKTDEFSNTDEFHSLLSLSLKKGMSYPAAYEAAILSKYKETDSSLYSPNNILGIEYCRALSHLNSSGRYDKLPKLLTVRREGSSYHDELLSAFPSATSARKVLNTDSPETLSDAVPGPVYDLLKSGFSMNLPINEDDFSDMLYIKLNSILDEELGSIPDMGKDLKNKLLKCRGRHVIVTKLIEKAKSKGFTYTSISRALFRILLSPFYSKAYFHMQSTIGRTPYLRVLGFKDAASPFLRLLRNSDTCTIITKPADGDMDNPMYKLDIYAADLYSQICANKYKTGFTDELKTGPVIIL